MKYIIKQHLSLQEQERLYELWLQEYPARLCFKSLELFQEYLYGLVNVNHTLLIDDANLIQGWAFDFIREDEKWYAIVLDSRHHKKGYGTGFLEYLKSKEKSLNGWVVDHSTDTKLNGEPYPSSIDFYIKRGFKVDVATRLELDEISAVKIYWEREKDA